jgi:hypothetical protein
MRILTVVRLAIGTSIVAAMLAGCGGPQPPIGALVAMPQTSANAPHAARGKSWMLPEARDQSLVYANSESDEAVYVFGFRKGKLLGKITNSDFDEDYGICSDRKGNVFVITFGFAYPNIFEYAHGGTQPIATLSGPGDALACGYDRTTNNLAVITYDGNIEIYQNESGMPTLYEYSNLLPLFCAYDDKGNLFIDGITGKYPQKYILVELSAGSKTFTQISFSQSVAPGTLE